MTLRHSFTDTFTDIPPTSELILKSPKVFLLFPHKDAITSEQQINFFERPIGGSSSKQSRRSVKFIQSKEEHGEKAYSG